MTRIGDALARARAMGRPEGRLTPDNGEPEGLGLRPIEWVSERGDDGLRPAEPPEQDPVAQVENSNGHEPSGPHILGEQGIEKLASSYGGDPVTVEQYRRLAAMLHLTQAQRAVKLVMVASAVAGEGKTFTATNLALTFSNSYRRNVLLVDGDLRRPQLHDIFQIPNVSGLNDTLTAEVGAKVTIVQVSKTLSLLTAGRPAPDPMNVLSSERMIRVLHEARARFDWVLIDTPPVTVLTDASLLASMVDLVVLVIEAGKTRFEVVQRAVEAIGRDRIFGVVLNRVQPPMPPGYDPSRARGDGPA